MAKFCTLILAVVAVCLHRLGIRRLARCENFLPLVNAKYGACASARTPRRGRIGVAKQLGPPFLLPAWPPSHPRIRSQQWLMAAPSVRPNISPKRLLHRCRRILCNLHGMPPPKKLNTLPASHRASCANVDQSFFYVVTSAVGNSGPAAPSALPFCDDLTLQCTSSACGYETKTQEWPQY